LTAGRLALRLESVPLIDLVRDVVARLRDQAAEAGSPIEVDTPEAIVGRWDRIRIEQIVDEPAVERDEVRRREANPAVGLVLRTAACGSTSRMRVRGSPAPIRPASFRRSSA
jgi:hypothetical protein